MKRPLSVATIATVFATAELAMSGVLQLDGFDGWVELTNLDGGIPTGADSFTIEAWINPTSIPNGGSAGGQITFWGNQAGNQANGFRLQGSEGVVHYFWGNDHSVTGLGDMLEDTTGPNADGWHHLAISYDGASNTSTWFKDGAVIGTPGQARNAGVNVADANYRIGSRINDEFFHGLIDEIRIWDIPRTEAEVASTFENELPVDTGGLVAYYKFDSADDYSDATGNGHDGSPMGLGASIDTALNAPVSPAEDSDGDGLPDAWEETWFGEGNLSQGPDDNPDNDGLTNAEELAISVALDPTEADTDGDGLDDGPEVNTHMTDPLDGDSDGDNLLDGAEVNGSNGFVTDPLDPDSDGDTVNDDLDPDPNNPNIPNAPDGFGALCLDGQGDFVTFANDSGLIPSGDEPFTIEAWINPTSIPAGGQNGGQITFWGTQGPSNTSNGFRLRGTGGVRHYFWGNDHDEDFPDTPDVTPDDSGPNADGWHHLAVTYNGAETNWYWNGAPLGLPRAVSGLGVADQNHRIGSRINAEYFDGWIDEIRVWEVSRTADEVAQNYDLALPANTPGLVSYWDFTGGFTDITGNGHDGMPMGDAFVSPFLNAPVSSAAPLAITGILYDEEASEVTVEWNSNIGRIYGVFSSFDLEEWEELDDGVVATGETTSYTDEDLPPGTPAKFYRVLEME